MLACQRHFARFINPAKNKGNEFPRFTNSRKLQVFHHNSVSISNLSKAWNKSFGALDLPKGINILMIQRSGQEAQARVGGSLPSLALCARFFTSQVSPLPPQQSTMSALGVVISLGVVIRSWAESVASYLLVRSTLFAISYYCMLHVLVTFRYTGIYLTSQEMTSRAIFSLRASALMGWCFIKYRMSCVFFSGITWLNIRWSSARRICVKLARCKMSVSSKPY